MKGKVVLVMSVLISLLFISPYVSSFAFDEIHYDLNNVAGYLVYDFNVITGFAPIDTEDSGDGSGSAGGICDGVLREEGEACDGDDLNGNTCTDLGFYGGTLTCLSDCSWFDTSECTNCGNGICDIDETCSGCSVDCEGVQADCLSGQICENLGGLQGFGCLEVAAPMCGDGVVEGTEVCEHSQGYLSDPSDDNLNSETCVTQGFNSGILACSNSCLAFDTSGCLNGDQQMSPEVSSDDDEESPFSAPIICADVNGVCSDSCINGFVYYNNTNFDGRCENSYGEGLVCCVPAYVLIDGDSEDNQETTDGDEFSGNVKGVEDYMIEDGVQTSPVNYDLEKGMKRILMSPSYAMGGVWIVFALTLFVVGISFYLHRKIYIKK
jgi:hypothetical protein